jgi:NADPH-dependent curcumin reductase
MPQREPVNRRVVLAARPRGVPTRQEFRIDEAAVPKPNEGQVLLPCCTFRSIHKCVSS